MAEKSSPPSSQDPAWGLQALGVLGSGPGTETGVPLPTFWNARMQSLGFLSATAPTFLPWGQNGIQDFFCLLRRICDTGS